MTDDDLLVRADKHRTAGDGYLCIHCGERWPCTTSGLAAALRAAKDETHAVREGMRRRVIESQQEADRLEAELRAARDAIRWLVEEGYPDVVEEAYFTEDGPERFNPRDDMLTRMEEDDQLAHDDTVTTWPDHTPALAAVVQALAVSAPPITHEDDNA